MLFDVSICFHGEEPREKRENRNGTMKPFARRRVVDPIGDERQKEVLEECIFFFLVLSQGRKEDMF